MLCNVMERIDVAIKAILNWRGQTILHYQMEQLRDVDDFCTAVEAVLEISRKKSTRKIDIIVTVEAPRLVGEAMLNSLTHASVLACLRHAKLQRLVLVVQQSSLWPALDTVSAALTHLDVRRAANLDDAHRLLRDG